MKRVITAIALLALTAVTATAQANAVLVLRELSARIAVAPAVYGTGDGGVALDLRYPAQDAAIVTILEPDGTGTCYFDFENRKGWTHRSDVGDLLEDAVWPALRKIGIGT